MEQAEAEENWDSTHQKRTLWVGSIPQRQAEEAKLQRALLPPWTLFPSRSVLPLALLRSVHPHCLVLRHTSTLYFALYLPLVASFAGSFQKYGAVEKITVRVKDVDTHGPNKSWAFVRYVRRMIINQPMHGCLRGG